MNKLFTALAAAMLTNLTLMAQMGSCGEDVTWSISGNTLTISGTGPMDNYAQKDVYHPIDITPSWTPFINDIKHVVIEPGVTTVGEYTFFKNAQIETVSFPEGLISIGACSFWGCSGLTEVVFPNSLEKFGHYTYTTSIQVIGSAFRDCTGLTSITIPENVTEIGDQTFAGCKNLSHVSYCCINAEAENAGYYDNSGSTNYVFSGCGIKSVEFSPAVKVLPPGLFRGHKLDKLKTGGNIEIVGANALDLSSPVFAEILTGPVMIDHALYAYYPEGPKAFSLTLPEGTTSMTKQAIKSNNIYLYELVIPESFYDMGPEALSGCTSLTNLVWNAKRCNINCGTNTAYAGPFGNALYSVTLGPNVKELNTKLFCRCSGIKKIQLPNSLEKIEGDVFSYCTGLTELVIPDSVTIVQGQTGLSSLRKLVIGESVQALGTFGFYDNNYGRESAIETIVWNARACESKYQQNLKPFSGEIKKLEIGPAVEIIPAYCFYGQNKLEHIYFSQNSVLKEIMDNALNGCGALQDLYIPESVTNIGADNLSSLTLDTLFLPSSLKRLDWWMNNCNINSTVISTLDTIIADYKPTKGNPTYYVPNPEIYNLGDNTTWGRLFSNGYIQPLVTVTDDVVNEFSSVNGVIQFDSKGLICNLPGYEVEFDFEANGTTPGRYQKVKATFSGHNKFSAYIPFEYTISNDFDSITSTESKDAEIPIATYDLTGRKTSGRAKGIIIERMSNGSTRKTLKR